MARMLEATGDYRVRWAYSGAEGLQEMRARRPDVLLLDMLMPDMDGSTLLAAMRQDAALADIPVIVVTASDPESGVGHARGGLLAVVRDHGFPVADSLQTLEAVLDKVRPDYFTGEEAAAPEAASPA